MDKRMYLFFVVFLALPAIVCTLPARGNDSESTGYAADENVDPVRILDSKFQLIKRLESNKESPFIKELYKSIYNEILEEIDKKGGGVELIVLFSDISRHYETISESEQDKKYLFQKRLSIYKSYLADDENIDREKIKKRYKEEVNNALKTIRSGHCCPKTT